MYPRKLVSKATASISDGSKRNAALPSVKESARPMKLDPRNRIRVAVCICTFRRQRKLRELLDGLAQLRFGKLPGPQIRIVVVDNDGFASGREVCESVSVPWPIAYVIESQRGISQARNRAVVEAGEVEFIAFIDDDEVPSANWLDELLWAQKEFCADVVSGPVLPKFAPEVAEWVKQGGFFDPRVSGSGTPRTTCASNNVLIATDVFRRVLKFDDAFSLSGAEDTDFFLRASQAGCKIVWAHEAVVSETISPERANVAWLLRREYQTGNGWVFCEARVNGSLHNWMLRLMKACAHAALGSLTAIAHFLMLNKAGVVGSLQRVSLGLGMLSGLFGHRFMAYRNAGAKFLNSSC